MLRVMLMDETPERSFSLRLVLERVGYDVVAEISDPHTLHNEALRLSPDVIIIDTNSPSRDTLESVCMIAENCPRPVVMFAKDAAREAIREAMRAGVTSYVVDEVTPERVEPIVDTAVARFELFQTMKSELGALKAKLSERKLVEKAKGILMQSRNLSEEEAYRALRKQAMDHGMQLAAVARQVIAVADLLT